MSENPQNKRHMPPLSVNPHEIRSRLRTLAAVERCGNCGQPIIDAICDIARLLTQTEELHTALAAERLRSATLEAAMRAALSACHDGECDPLAYLRYELPSATGGDADDA